MVQVICAHCLTANRVPDERLEDRPSCGKCRAMAPAFEAAAAELAGRLRFAKVNTDEAQSLAQRYAIRGIPTLILFDGGREVNRVSGALDKLVQWIENA